MTDTAAPATTLQDMPKVGTPEWFHRQHRNALTVLEATPDSESQRGQVAAWQYACQMIDWGDSLAIIRSDMAILAACRRSTGQELKDLGIAEYQESAEYKAGWAEAADLIVAFLRNK